MDTDLIIKKDEVRKQEQFLSAQRKGLETSELKALFGAGTKSKGDFRIVELEANIKKYKADIDAFVIAADYDLIKKEADALSYQLKEQRNKATLIINAIHNIEKKP